VVDYLADDVAVMYLGRIVESGSAAEILGSPRHPYTAALLAAVPRVEGEGQAPPRPLAGDLPSPMNPPDGCHFHPRCPQAMDICRNAYPTRTGLSPSHGVCCHLYGEGARRG
jgi:peptide/nickel transport system ATP-binding protein